MEISQAPIDALDALIANGDAPSRLAALQEMITWPADSQPTEPFYIALLITYYSCGQLDQAHLTWKRIPENTKTERLAAVAKVGQHVRAREYPQAQAAIRALEPQLDASQAGLLRGFAELFDRQVWGLIQKAYSSMRVDVASAMLGVPEDDVKRAASEMGITEDTSRGMLYVSAASSQRSLRMSGDAAGGDSGSQLGALAEYITALER